MRYIISGKNIDITDGLRSAVMDKLGKLERYFTSDTEVYATLSVEPWTVYTTLALSTQLASIYTLC